MIPIARGLGHHGHTNQGLGSPLGQSGGDFINDLPTAVRRQLESKRLSELHASFCKDGKSKEFKELSVGHS